MTNLEMQEILLNTEFGLCWNKEQGKEFRIAVIDLMEERRRLKCENKTLIKQNERFEESIDDKNLEIEKLEDKISDLMETLGAKESNG